MTSPQKRKGNGFEREVVEEFHRRDLTAQRAWGSDGRALGWHSDVDVVGDYQKLQCKRRKHISSYLKPTKTVDAVLAREDGNKQIYVVLRFEDWLQLLEDRKA